MMPNRLIYIAILIVSIMLFLISDSYYIFLLLIIVLSIPVIMGVYIGMLKGRLECSSEDADIILNRNADESISIRISNKSMLNVLTMQIRTQLINLLTDSKKEQMIAASIPAGNEREYQIKYSFEHSGCYLLKITDAKVYDPLKLFSFKMELMHDVNFRVMPQRSMREFEFGNADAESDSEAYLSGRGTDNLSEILGVREYHSGDRLNSINWKLTSKLDELMVREYAQPASRQYLLAAELFLDESSKAPFDKTDALFDALFSASYSLLTSCISHKICWFDIRDGVFRELEISSDEDLNHAFKEILSGRLYSDEDYTAKYIKDIFGKTFAEKAFYFTSNDDEEIIVGYYEFFRGIVTPLGMPNAKSMGFAANGA